MSQTRNRAPSALQYTYSVLKEDVRPKHWRNDGADTVESLGEVDTDLRVSRRPADGDIWIRRGFQGSKSITDDEDSCAEPAERSIYQARPCYQGANAVEAEAPYEDDLEAVVSQPGHVSLEVG